MRIFAEFEKVKYARVGFGVGFCLSPIGGGEKEKTLKALSL